MIECIHKTEEIVEKGKTIMFENKTDTAFDVSVGIMFHKSGLYRVSIMDEKVSVKMEQERTAEQKHGKWIWKGEEGDSRWMCSECKCKEYVPTCNGVPDIWEYCPNCGARMEE